MRLCGTLFIAGLALMPRAAGAGVSENRGDALVSSIAACASLPNEQRLACYERTSAVLVAARDRREIRIIDRETLQIAKRSLFGFSLPHLNLFGNGKEDPRAVSDTDVKEVTSTVTSVRQSAYGLWTFVLAEGGEWQSLNESLTFEPRRGDKITIRAGLLGHYMGKIGDGRAVDVKRLR